MVHKDLIRNALFLGECGVPKKNGKRTSDFLLKHHLFFLDWRVWWLEKIPNI